MKTDELRSIWDDLRKSRAYQKRLDPKHPLDFFLGISSEGKDELILITTEEPYKIKSSKQLSVEKNKRGIDSRWATQIILESQEYSDIFSQFCLDLLDVSKDCLSEHKGLIAVTTRFLAWQKMFSIANNRISDSVIKGLVGELYFANNKLSKFKQWNEIITSWMGPEGGDRDYVMDDTWYEVKSIATGKDYLTISSLNQLDVDSVGFLVLYYVDKSTKIDDHAFSVASLIRAIKNKLADYPDALQEFNTKLLMVGYAGQDEFEDMFYRCSDETIYIVDESFPKLTTKNVPHEIMSASYSISIAAISQWKE